jgi:N-acetyl-gamma-glutamyl-phosphate reductase
VNVRGGGSSHVDYRLMHGYAFTVEKIPVGVLGASGYAGRELSHLILGHPGLELRFATANGQRGAERRRAGRVITYSAPEDAAFGEVELVFSALPHGASSPSVEAARVAGARVVDLSADLRPGSGCGEIPYGLTELSRPSIIGASLVANPGCYATAALLAIVPFVQSGLVDADHPIIIDAASGVTGAGNAPNRDLLFGEVTEDFRAYKVGNVHHHLLEMSSTVASSRTGVELLFTPHLLPVARGILATITITLSSQLPDPMSPWRERYAGERFIEISEEPPTLRDVAHRNVARMYACTARGVRRPTVVAVVAIDNLLKGAAGQALQNANLMLGLDEGAGLPA